ncbi:AAA family ATPase [Shewanella algae]|uniref:AAA family ATPase n=1 Tax=Shewanella algae TaxID=38313 RepID=UPI001AAD435A|nr:AAA family ATPase [Shewanella algae]MBO2604353.1 AAA family ATPase [Shewanella algae]
MTLLNQILKWTESLQSWQRDACRRLFQQESALNETDLSELYALLKKDCGIESDDALLPIPLAKEHLPAELAPGEQVTLVALRDLQNVNQIPSDRILTFSEAGITVIYGGNGSGKSGYARVMKRACRARDQSEPVHPDANDPTASKRVPTAKFDVKVMGVSHEVDWARDTTSPDQLSSISVFDSKCARSYITAEQDVAYLPYGLDIIESLANRVLPKLSEMLESEINGIDVSKLPFEHLLGDTEVGRVIENLSIKSNTETITSLGTITEGDIKRIAELENALKEGNPLAKAEESKRSMMRLKAFADKLAKPLVWVSSDAVEKLQKIHDEKISAEDAEKKAADALCSGEELLPGTGEQVWKLLFDAARRYSTEVAYPGEEFPQSAEGKVCPLCQENLPESGANRLKRFDEYIQNDVAKSAEAARNKVEIAKAKIKAADLMIAADDALGEELKVLDDSILQVISDFQASIDSRREFMLQCLETSKWAEVPALNVSPRGRIRQLAAQQLRIFRTLTRAADETKRTKLERELSELTARQSLAKSLNAVVELLGRMNKKSSLEKCRPALKTRSISDKSKEFATVAVTDELRKALDKEFEALGIGHIKTKLKERSSRGKMYHQLLLDLPVTNKIDEILSEGEQRAIALGSFFAELALANHSCGIILDDPVSSLDHWRRRNVARRLVEEAKNRQVVVFTHDTSFLGQLSDEIEAAGIPNSTFFLEWRGGAPGCVNDGLPWDHQGYKARINALEQAQSKLAKTWPAYPNEKEIGDMRHQYDRLRATLERVIQDVVFNGVVKRYRDWIRVDSLEEVVGFSRLEYEAIEKLHKRSCDVVTAHDPSSAKAAAVPSAADLGNDIVALKAIVEAIQNRRKTAKATA